LWHRLIARKGIENVSVYCGIDWAENHHDNAIVDDTGRLLARRRITDPAAGLSRLLELLTEHDD
jgi:Transposase